MALQTQTITSGYYSIREVYDDATLRLQSIVAVNPSPYPIWYRVTFQGNGVEDTLQSGQTITRDVSGLNIVGTRKAGAGSFVLFPVSLETRYPA
jgi:hypothetical protein